MTSRRRKCSRGRGTGSRASADGSTNTTEESKHLTPGGGRPESCGTGSPERLPSLRPRRDLTLGGVPKKTFAPTVPTRRVKKEVTADGLPTSVGKMEKQLGDMRRKSVDRKRRKGRGKDVITSASVFSMGPAERTMERRKELLFRGTFGEAVQNSREQEHADHNSDKDHKHICWDMEEEPVEDIPDEELFSSSILPPIQLPLDYNLHTTQRTVLSKQVKMTQVSSQGGSAAPVKLVIGPSAPVKHQETTAAELFSPRENFKGQFLFFQLPDCLPLVRPSREAPMELEGASGTKEQTTFRKELQQHCCLADVPEGLTGKLLVHKSGKVKLSLGSVTLDVAMGTPRGFLQQLVSVQLDHRVPEMVVLGQFSHRLVCTPDLQSLLSSSNSKSSNVS